MPNKNTHYKNSAARFILCMMLIAVFFLTAYVVSNWQSNKASVSFQTRSELPNGTKVKPIQDVEVGERAIGRNPQLTDQDRSTFFADPDPSLWRKLTLEMIKSNGKRLDITLLRPLSWIEEVKAEQGGMIYLDLPEMGAQGDAKVLAIDPCPPIKPGKGNVITGTFHHEAGETIDIHVQGLDKPIGCTANHPFWSETRHDFVEAGTLQPQEDLLLYDGQITKVIQILPRPGPERVHNLEIFNEHVYYVENVGVLVHNKCESFESKTDPQGRITRVDASVSPKNIRTGSGTNQKIRDYSNSMNDKGGKVDAGHIIANILGGYAIENNITPISPSVNRGKMSRHEKAIASYVKSSNSTAKVTVVLVYEGNSTRAIKIHHTAVFPDGKIISETFDN